MKDEPVVPPEIPPIDPYPEGWVEPKKVCSGECLTAYDIGLPEYGSMVAYGHPDCPLHGWGVFEIDDGFEAFKAGWAACCEMFGVGGHKGAFDYWEDTLRGLYDESVRSGPI